MVHLLTIEDGIAEQGLTSEWLQDVRIMKEDICFVSFDPEADKAKAGESDELTKQYELPDGQTVAVNTPRFMAPEVIFFPNLIKDGDEHPGLFNLAYASI